MSYDNKTPGIHIFVSWASARCKGLEEVMKLKSSKSSRAEVMLQHLDAPLPLEEIG
jgi:hypothetical protein